MYLAAQAAIIAAKKAWLPPIAVAIYATASVTGWKAAIGPEGVAALAALFGVGARWLWFKLAFTTIWREFLAAPLTAVIFATMWPKIVADQLGEAGDSGPQIMGFLIGMFGLLVVSYVSDFLTAYKIKRGEAP